MKILIYKRTHNGDPDKSGTFGSHDCMGSIRRLPFDAVIGVGGTGSEPESHNIDRRINWIGIWPQKTIHVNLRGPLVSFKHYMDFGTSGPELREIAPNIATRLYDRRARFIFSDLSKIELSEAKNILRLARRAMPSKRFVRDRTNKKNKQLVVKQVIQVCPTRRFRTEPDRSRRVPVKNSRRVEERSFLPPLSS